MKDVFLSRRRCLQVSALAGCSMLLGGGVSAAEEPVSADHIRPGPIAPQETGKLRSLMGQLGKAPRRRDFKTVRFKVNEIARSFQDTAETLLLDTYLTNEEAAKR
jgi:hypothetical protein